MSTVFSNLELIPRNRQGEKLPSGIFKTERAFFDFVIDGISLHSSMACKYDLTSVLWINAPVPAEIERCLRRLLLVDPGDLPDDRVSLYVCAECGDLGCGGITVDIKVHGDAIVWSEFGYQNNYDENFYDTDFFQNFGPYHFELNRYRAVLLSSLPVNRKH